MSIGALNWAFDQRVRPSSVKFVLVAIADCADTHSGTAWPSIEHLCSTTSQDRKTVIAALQRLVDTGWIADTGERRGRTKQVRVFRLLGFPPSSARMPKTGRFEAPPRMPASVTPNGPENGTIPAPVLPSETVPEAGSLNDPESGTVPVSEPFRFSAERVPDFPEKGPVFPSKGSQKRDTEPRADPLEASRTEPHTQRVRDRAAEFEALDAKDIETLRPYLGGLPVELPLDLALFADFVRHCAVLRKPLSISAFKLLGHDLRQLVAGGGDVNEALRTTIRAGNCVRLIDPRKPFGGSGASPRPRVADDFAQVDYSKP